MQTPTHPSLPARCGALTKNEFPFSHGEKEAERIIEAAAKLFERDGSDWTTLPKGDWRKGLVAGLIRERSLVPNGWVTQRLTMGATGAVSRTIGEARERTKSERKVGRAARELIRNVQSF